jgi:serine/threonine-protein phosphatase 5
LNGDFLDRGSFLIEVILILFAFKSMSLTALYLSRGNHGSKCVNQIYGFEGGVVSKYNEGMDEIVTEVSLLLAFGSCPRLVVFLELTV